jgi:hypothetical protein
MPARLAGVVLLALAVVLGASGATSAKLQRLHRYGVSVQLPAKWHARLYFRTSLNGSVLQAGTVPIRGYGDDTAAAAQRLLGRDDVLIVLFEYGPDRNGRYTGVTDFPRRSQPLSPPRVTGVSFEGQPAPGQAMETLQTAGRYLQLFVFYGRRRPSPAQLALVRRVVGGIRIAPLGLAERARLRAAKARLALLRGRGVPRGFTRLAALPGLGSLWWRCAGLGAAGRAATAFVGGRATDGVVVRVATRDGDERRAARTVQPGEWVATPALRSFHFTWRVTQTTEPKTVRARFDLDAPPLDAHICFIPAVRVWQRTLPHS